MEKLIHLAEIVQFEISSIDFNIDWCRPIELDFLMLMRFEYLTLDQNKYYLWLTLHVQIFIRINFDNSVRMIFISLSAISRLSVGTYI